MLRRPFRRKGGVGAYRNQSQGVGRCEGAALWRLRARLSLRPVRGVIRPLRGTTRRRTLLATAHVAGRTLSLKRRGCRLRRNRVPLAAGVLQAASGNTSTFQGEEDTP